MKKRTFLCALLALTLLLTACGGDPVSSGSASSSAGSSSASGSGEESFVIPEYMEMDFSLGLLDNGCYDGVRALDYVTLPALEGVALPADKQSLTEEEVQGYIDTILQEYATDGRIYDRAVVEGDQVNIDYVGSVDGVEFDGGSTNGMGTTVTAGATNYIDDFLTQIIGAKPGDTVNVEVTFPDPYDLNPDLAGKDALFVTRINYIQGEPVVPELTEELVREKIGPAYGFADLADMDQTIRTEMLREKQRIYVLEYLYENSSFRDVPEKLVDDRIVLLKTELNNTAAGAGVPLDILVNYYGFETMDALVEDYMPEAVQYTEQYLMCQAAAEQIGIEITDGDITEYLCGILKLDAAKLEGYYEDYGKGYFAQEVIVYQVGEYLVDHAVNG